MASLLRPAITEKSRFPLAQKPSPEEKVAHCLRWRLSIYNRLRTDVFVISSDFGGSVTEEGKRTCPYAD
ncbi:MAG: hypothetical protein IIU98_02870, partial [Ruminococcus sp.]|nr:hypothetical protein [Ruminococcus sp.]